MTFGCVILRWLICWQIQAKDAVLKSMEGKPIYIPPVRADLLPLTSSPRAPAAAASPHLVATASSPSILRPRTDSASSSVSSSYSLSLSISSATDEEDGSDDISSDHNSSSEENVALSQRRQQERNLKIERQFRKQLKNLEISQSTTFTLFFVHANCKTMPRDWYRGVSYRWTSRSCSRASAFSTSRSAWLAYV